MNDINHIITIAFAVCYYAVSLFLVRKTRFTTRNLCLCGIVIAMTIILDAIRIPLPTGATMALGSPIPLMLLATVTDYRHAIISGWVVGILVMFLNQKSWIHSLQSTGCLMTEDIDFTYGTRCSIRAYLNMFISQMENYMKI